MTARTMPRIKRKRSMYVIGGLLALAAAALAGYAWQARTPPPPAAGALEQVTIAANVDYVGVCPVLAARSKGYFVEQGIVVRIQPHNSGKSSLEAMLQGKADLGTVADIPIALAALKGLPVVVVATVFRTEKDHGLVGRRDRGIESAASLKGKRVGVTIGTSGHFVLDAMLNRQGLAPADVVRLDLKPEQFSAALTSGDVDAIATWEPYLDSLRAQLGSNGVSVYSEDVYEIPYNLASTRDYVARHPGTLKKVLRALVEGARFCASAPDAARALMVADRKTVDTSRWKVLWPAYRFHVALDQGLLLALEDETRWAIANKLTDQSAMPNYLDHVYLDALEAVAPAAVTVIH